MNLFQRLRDPLKRTVDLLGAGTSLVLLAPVIGAVWLTVRFKLGSPVIFAQQRPGKDGHIFTLYKFRSMLEADPDRGLVTDDQRMTAFGRRLRATSLDELPSLVNVLKGDMSLVGPRPLVTEYLPLYSEHQARRHHVRPGITGLAQVNGRNQLSWEERFDLDVDYVARHNLLLDLKILYKTVSRVMSRSGIEGDRISTVPMFVGAPPEDGLSEEIMNEAWQKLQQRWRQDPRSMQLGSDRNGLNTCSWVYLDAAGTPVGIGGLSGLGSSSLEAYLLISPEQHDGAVVQALLDRLIYHGKSFDAKHLILRGPNTQQTLHHNAQRLGFVAADANEYSLAVASETGA